MFIRTQIAFEVAAGGSIVSKIENSIYPLMREESIGAKDLVTFIFRYVKMVLEEVFYIRLFLSESTGG